VAGVFGHVCIPYYENPVVVGVVNDLVSIRT
jgi:hypothetical protein